VGSELCIRVSSREPVASAAPAEVTAWGLRSGLVLIGVGLYGTLLRIEQPLLANSATFTGVVMIAASVFQRRQRTVVGYAFVVAAIAVYTLYIFTGYGRLQLGSLGIAVAMLAVPRWRGRTVKIIFLGAMVPAIGYLAHARVALVSQRYGIRGTENGLESIVAPLVRFAQLLSLNADGRLVHNDGSSFWAAAVTLIPRKLWQGKPDGLGPELLALFSPRLAGTGHSEVTFYLGEWVLAFGIVGCVLAAVLIGIVLRSLNGLTIRAYGTPIRNRYGILRITAVTILCSGIPDYVWAGAGTYIARVGSRLLFIGILFLLCVVTTKGPRQSTPTSESSGIREAR
jgi:hypothetical protein